MTRKESPLVKRAVVSSCFHREKNEELTDHGCRKTYTTHRADRVRWGLEKDNCR